MLRIVTEYESRACFTLPISMSGFGHGVIETNRFSWKVFFRLIDFSYVEKQSPFYIHRLICKECNGEGCKLY